MAVKIALRPATQCATELRLETLLKCQKKFFLQIYITLKKGEKGSCFSSMFTKVSVYQGPGFTINQDRRFYQMSERSIFYVFFREKIGPISFDARRSNQTQILFEMYCHLEGYQRLYIRLI